MIKRSELPVVDVEDIAQMPLDWSAVNKLTESESELLLHMEDNCTSGSSVKRKAASAIRSREGLKNPNDRLPVSLFRSHWVGKTELTKAWLLTLVLKKR